MVNEAWGEFQDYRNLSTYVSLKFIIIDPNPVSLLLLTPIIIIPNFFWGLTKNGVPSCHDKWATLPDVICQAK